MMKVIYLIFYDYNKKNHFILIIYIFYIWNSLKIPIYYESALYKRASVLSLFYEQDSPLPYVTYT